MNSLANEITAKAIVEHRLEYAEAARVAASAVARSRDTKRAGGWKTLRLAVGTSIEMFGRRLAGSSGPAASDSGC
jgi:hypothetical protein